MQLIRQLDILKDNLPLVEANLGDRWDEFKEKFKSAHNELETGNLEKAENILESLFREINLPGFRRVVRTRGVLSATLQIPPHQYEILLSQRIQISQRMQKIEDLFVTSTSNNESQKTESIQKKENPKHESKRP
jgi:hypothetical protein